MDFVKYHEYAVLKLEECVAVLTELYNKNGAVSCVGFGFFSV